MKHSIIVYLVCTVLPSSLHAIPVEMSYGELIDKITILRIKKDRIKESNKLRNITHELQILETIVQELPESQLLTEHIDALTQANIQLWDIEDAIRIKEAQQQFDEEFIQLARNVYLTNDERVRVKRAINTLLSCPLQEEKSYKGYKNNF